jgi:hypothetical protein
VALRVRLVQRPPCVAFMGREMRRGGKVERGKGRGLSTGQVHFELYRNQQISRDGNASRKYGQIWTYVLLL